MIYTALELCGRRDNMSITEEQLLQSVKEQMDDPIKIIGFLEHQLDYQQKIISLLIQSLETNGFDLPEELIALKPIQDGFLKHSSVDFNDIAHPFQSYKIPKAIEKKERQRITQERYLNKKMVNGIF